MKNDLNLKVESIVADAYNKYHPDILSYITNRIIHKYDAEDLAQDVFLRLLDYKQMVRPDTIKYFLFTISRNIVTDHIRRYYKRQEFDAYIYETSASSTNETEETCIVKDILYVEKRKLDTFAPQRKIVYMLNRFEEKTVEEISIEMGLSRSTIENHLLLGRKEMRSYMRKCI